MSNLIQKLINYLIFSEPITSASQDFKISTIHILQYSHFLIFWLWSHFPKSQKII